MSDNGMTNVVEIERIGLREGETLMLRRLSSDNVRLESDVLKNGTDHKQRVKCPS
jgi:hypothetical protein